MISFADLHWVDGWVKGGLGLLSILRFSPGYTVVVTDLFSVNNLLSG